MTSTGNRSMRRQWLCWMIALWVGGCGMLGGKQTADAPPVAANDPPAAPAVGVTQSTPPPVTVVVPGVKAEAPPVPAGARPDLLATVDLATLAPDAAPVALTSGRNEWVSVVLRVRAPGAGEAASLALPKWLSGGRTLPGKALRVYQVLPMPLNVNRAGYVRQTGQRVTDESLPRALLPVGVIDGRVDLARLRDPAKPTDPKANAVDENVLLWIDVRVPTETAAGHYDGQFVWTAAATEKQPAAARASLGMGLDVADFVLSDDRHLNMVADLSWDRLRRLWPERFEVVRPQLLSRSDPASRPAVAMLDSLMTLAQENRVQVHVPRLQPVAKWKPNLPVQIDWSDYDGLIGPWLSGAAFPDKVPLGFWALPRVEYLDNLPAATQVEYYGAAAGHFDGHDWLRLSPVILTKDTPGAITLEERLRLSVDASRVLRAHPRVRVMLPLEPAEAMLADADNPTRIDPDATGRLNCVAPGLISNSALQNWPKDLKHPQNWLRTDLSGLIPYTGAGGDEADVRVWAWAAFLRQANLVQWDACLPAESTPDQPADPEELVWFYPGSWFGVDDPVPTVQLKWLRRAEQDFEYLRLAQVRDSLLKVLPIARVLAKPVVLQPGQTPSPVYSMLIGTADPAAWRAMKPIVTKIIESRGPGITPDDDVISDLQQQTLQWIEPLERPAILPRSTQWSVGTPPPGETGIWANLTLNFDLYNASDTTPSQNELSIAKPQDGWQINPAPVAIPKLQMYEVAPHGLTVRIDPAKAAATPRRAPVRINYKSGYNGLVTPLDVVAPVGRSVRRTAPLVINGSLDDWEDEDALQIGPLVSMLTRPSVQAHEIKYATTPTDLYSAWSDTDFYLAFRADGLPKSGGVSAYRNFVEYQDGRAWGEDLCQVIVQAVYDDGTVGPLVHVAVKPGGNVWVEKRPTPRDPWQPFPIDVRYATTVAGSVWRGEIAVPWAALTDDSKTAAFAAQGRPNLPTMLKFNFVQHKRDSGESASWAGPVDTARDAEFTGVVVLKEPE